MNVSAHLKQLRKKATVLLTPSGAMTVPENWCGVCGQARDRHPITADDDRITCETWIDPDDVLLAARTDNSGMADSEGDR